jgi:hypothetical protein
MVLVFQPQYIVVEMSSQTASWHLAMAQCSELRDNDGIELSGNAIAHPDQRMTLHGNQALCGVKIQVYYFLRVN